MTGNRELFTQEMNRGHTAAWEQKWDQAVVFYRKALEEIPEEVSALNSLGLALFELRHYGDAIKFYQQAARLQPDDPLPFERIGLIFEIQLDMPKAVKAYSMAADRYLKTQGIEKSIDNWLKILSLQPDHLLAHSRLAVIYERMERKAEAVAEYHILAGLFQHQNENQKAVQVAEHALELIPENAETVEILARLHNNEILSIPTPPSKDSGQMRPIPIETSFQKPSSAVPVYYDPIEEGRRAGLGRLAEILFEETESQEHSQTNSGLSSFSSDSDSLNCKPADRSRIFLEIGQVIASESRGDHRQAADELGRAIEIGLAHPAAFFIYGLLIAKTDPSRAIKQLLVSVKNPRFALPSFLVLGQIYQSAADYEQAVHYFLQALRLADAETLPGGQVEDLLQLYEPILESQSGAQHDDAYLRKLCEDIAGQLIRPDWRQFLKSAREQLAPLSVNNFPVPLAQILLDSGSGQIVEIMTKIRKLSSSGAYRSAVEEAFNAIEIMPNYLPFQTQIGDILLQQNRTEEAVTKYRLVANLYALRGETGQAVGLLQKARQLVPMNLSIRQQLIDLFLIQGKIQDVVEQYLETGMIYYHLTDLEKALETYQTALDLTRKNPYLRSVTLNILYKIADINLQQLDWREAIRIFEQIRDLEPEDIDARAHIVTLNFRLNQEQAATREVEAFSMDMEKFGKPEKVIEFLRMILLDLPDNLDMKKRLADLYVKEGETGQAVQLLASITDSLCKTGQLRTAAKILETIIKLNPPDTEDYQKVLTNIQTRLAGS